MRIVRGDSLTMSLIWEGANGDPIDLTGADARMRVCDARGAAVLSASVADGRITVTGASGRIDVHVPYAETESIVPGAYRYAVEVTMPSGVRRTLIQGDLLVDEDLAP